VLHSCNALLSYISLVCPLSSPLSSPSFPFPSLPSGLRGLRGSNDPVAAGQPADHHQHTGVRAGRWVGVDGFRRIDEDDDACQPLYMGLRWLVVSWDVELLVVTGNPGWLSWGDCRQLTTLLLGNSRGTTSIHSQSTATNQLASQHPYYREEALSIVLGDLFSFDVPFFSPALLYFCPFALSFLLTTIRWPTLSLTMAESTSFPPSG
jgi:hypothetical protein